MRLLYITIPLSLAVFAACTYTPPTKRAFCDCEHCDGEKVIGLEENNNNPTISLPQMMYKEDIDGDGDRTICARDRDFNDRHFPSVCHMLCYNQCVRLRYLVVKENNVTKYVVNAYRTNYYKLRDGVC